VAKGTKKALRKLVRRAETELREAQLEARMIRAEAQVDAVRIREAGLVDAAAESERIRTEAQQVMSRLVEQTRAEAEAEARAIVAEAELATERTRAVAMAEVEQMRRETIEERAQARRETIEEREQVRREALEHRSAMRDEALLEAARIRENAAHEVIGFVRRLDDERAQLVANAHAESERILSEARVQATTERIRALAEMESRLEDQTRRILGVAVEEGERILREAEAERAGAEAVAARGATRAAQHRLSWTYDAATATALGRDEPAPFVPSEPVIEETLEAAAAPAPSPPEEMNAQDQQSAPLDDLFGPELDLDVGAATEDPAAEKPKRGLFRRRKKS